MIAHQLLSAAIQKVLAELWGITVPASQIVLQKTRKEFEGDLTLVTFPYVKQSKLGPEQTGQAVGEALKANNDYISGFNVVKGFLNISFSDKFWLGFFNSTLGN